MKIRRLCLKAETGKTETEILSSNKETVSIFIPEKKEKSSARLDYLSHCDRDDTIENREF